MKSSRWVFIQARVLMIFLLAACSSVATPDPNALKPSKPGGTGEALKLTGDAAQGRTVFDSKCRECHGEEGKGGVANGGAESGVVPALNPIAASLKNSDAKVFAANIDLFIEHGSVPKGTPIRIMMAYGDNGLLSPQQIADVIAYIISLNTQ